MKKSTILIILFVLSLGHWSGYRRGLGYAAKQVEKTFDIREANRYQSMREAYIHLKTGDTLVVYSNELSCENN